jgi:hypothetical protein
LGTKRTLLAMSKFFQQSKEIEDSPLAPSEHIEKTKPSEDHVTKEEFLMQFYGSFGRDLGTPERWFTDNPNDVFPFIEECAENKVPAFISVEPKSQGRRVDDSPDASELQAA